MADAASPARTPTAPQIAGRITELKVSGNLMTLDTGLFCLFQQPGQMAPPADGSGLPGVRISIPPQIHAVGRKGQGEVTIRGLHDDGWLGPRDGAVLVRVSGAPAQILITVYQSPSHPAESAPRLQVVPLSAEGTPAPATTAQRAARAAPAAAVAKPAPGRHIIAHVQRTGDVGVDLGEWLGKPGSGQWVEGFSIAPPPGIAAGDIEYQAVLGKGWLSPWIGAGKFCGSRGMALPMLGFNLRLRGKAAEQFTCEYRASFVDGTRVGPIPAGRSCEAASLSPLEAFQITLRRRAAKATAAKPATAKPVAPKRAAAQVPPAPPAKPTSTTRPAPRKAARPATRKSGR